MIGGRHGMMGEMVEPLVLLHGFGGTHRAWDQVIEQLPPERYRPLVLPDLPGHGARGSTRPISFDACVAAVLSDAPHEPFTLCGYSLGGRIAQLVALTAPERVARLILVSTSAGIEDQAERASRCAEDDALAAEIAQLRPIAFADRWQSLELFSGTTTAARALWREDLVRSDPADLGVALSGLSNGRMPDLWPRLPELTMPVTIIVGERDAKFVRLARRYRDVLPQAAVTMIAGAGHGLPREAPEALAAAISAEGPKDGGELRIDRARGPQ